MTNLALILFAAALAIVAHMLLPATVDVAQFDSILVRWFGFPAVATFYFVLLFTHCALVVRYVGLRTDAPKHYIGMRFGIAFAMIYLLGMQEIVLKGSGFSTWGPDFVRYQLVMGVGDALPAILLCLGIAVLTLGDRRSSVPVQKLPVTQALKAMAIIAVIIFVERAIGYQSGLVGSEVATYPVQTYIWTGLFAILIGWLYVLLYQLLSFQRQRNSIPLRLVAVIGVNWIVFNSFIGLILHGVMPQMLLRSGLDVAALFAAAMVLDRQAS